MRDFSERKVDVDVMHASLAYHVETDFDLRAKFLLDTVEAETGLGSSTLQSSDKGHFGQALEALYGSARNADAEPDFVDCHDPKFFTEMKVSKGKEDADLGWLPADKVKLQSQPLNIEDVEANWESFLKKCGHMTLALRSIEAAPYKSHLKRALIIDIRKFSSENFSCLRTEHRKLCELAFAAYTEFPNDAVQASDRFSELCDAEKARGTSFRFLYLGTSGASGQGHRSWYIRASAFRHLIKTELNGGVKDCSKGSYPLDVLRFPEAVYDVYASLSEEEMQDKLDPDRVLRDKPSKDASRQQGKATATPKRNPAQPPKREFTAEELAKIRAKARANIAARRADRKF